MSAENGTHRGEEGTLREFHWWDVRSVSRANVREPVSPHIRVVLYDPETRSSDVSVLLTVPQALQAIEQLSKQVREHVQRADIRKALANTDPGPCIEALGLAGPGRPT